MENENNIADNHKIKGFFKYNIQVAPTPWQSGV